MAPRTASAVRLFVQPVRGAIASQLVPPAVAGSKFCSLQSRRTTRAAPAARLPPPIRPSICLRCSFLRVGSGGFRGLYSTTSSSSRSAEAEPGKTKPGPSSSSSSSPSSSLSAEESSPVIFLDPPPPTKENPSAAAAPESHESAPPSSPSEPANKPGDDAAAASTSNSQANSPQPPPPPPPPTSPESGPELPSDTENKRHPAAARFSDFMDTLQARVFVASRKLNDLTGYSAIEQIKAENARLEGALSAAQARLRAARRAYKERTAHRAATQREVTTLLARKDAWAPPDLERFTALYRRDHELEAGVAAAAEELTDAEADESRLAARLNAGILRRYHEEQIWSDRIRRQSTWGTWGLMAVNVLLFLGLQFVAEPWKRGRLMRGVEEREARLVDDMKKEMAHVRAVLGEVTAAVAAVSTAAAAEKEEKEEKKREREREKEAAAEAAQQQQSSAAAAAEAPRSPLLLLPPSLSWKDAASDPVHWGGIFLRDLSSDRRIDLRMRDASLLALKAAAAGAALAGGIALLVFLGR